MKRTFESLHATWTYTKNAATANVHFELCPDGFVHVLRLTVSVSFVAL